MKNVIILSGEGRRETWGSLTMLCKHHPDFSYHFLKAKKYPFEYKGWLFEKLPYNKKSKES